MALTDKKIQELQVGVLDVIKEHNEGEDFAIYKGGPRYVLIKEVNETTQAIAVAPIVGKNQVDYSQTTIVVAGTQSPNGDINNHVAESVINAATARIQLTEQTKDVRKFYHQSLANAEKMAGDGQVVDISNMSGFSQSGPAVAKVAAEMRVQRITNFMDWGAWASLSQNTDHLSGITNEELAYLNQHLHSYSDKGKDMTSMDGHGGYIPYGKVFTVPGKNHNAGLPKIKGNSLDTEWYVKKGLYCSDMTKSQVNKLIDRYIEKNPKLVREVGAKNIRKILLEDYQKDYGDFAPELTKSQLIALNNQRIQEIQASMAGATGAGVISLREELVRATAQNAELQSQQFEEEIQKKIAEAKERLENHINEVRAAAYELAHNLSDQEIEDLLAAFTMRNSWHEGMEAETLAEAEQYKRALSELSGKLNTAADRIVEADREGAGLFAAE